MDLNSKSCLLTGHRPLYDTVTMTSIYTHCRSFILIRMLHFLDQFHLKIPHALSGRNCSGVGEVCGRRRSVVCLGSLGSCMFAPNGRPLVLYLVTRYLYVAICVAMCVANLQSMRPGPQTLQQSLALEMHRLRDNSQAYRLRLTMGGWSCERSDFTRFCIIMHELMWLWDGHATFQTKYFKT